MSAKYANYVNVFGKICQPSTIVNHFDPSANLWQLYKNVTQYVDLSACVLHINNSSTCHKTSSARQKHICKTSYSLEPRGQFDPNLAELILGSRKFSTKLSWVFWFFVMKRHAIFCFFFNNNIMKIFWQLFKSVYSWTIWQIIT